jgi:hypothetical protein
LDLGAIFTYNFTNQKVVIPSAGTALLLLLPLLLLPQQVADIAVESGAVSANTYGVI